MTNLDLYQILDAPRYATTEELKLAYRRQVWQLHPDVMGGDSNKMTQLNWAYAVLSDPEQRLVYDQSYHPSLSQAIAWVPSLGTQQSRVRLTLLWLVTAGVLWLCLEPVNMPQVLASAIAH